MSLGKKWTDAELVYLEEKWGVTSIPYMAKVLNKTTLAIQKKATKLGLGGHLKSAIEITFPDLILALGISNVAYHKKRWINILNLPVRKHKVLTSHYIVIDIGDFWEWAKTHQNNMSFAKFEYLTLGQEPDWVATKRKKDIERYYNRREWTPLENARLASMLQSFRFTYGDVAIELNRNQLSIRAQIAKLGIKNRPNVYEARLWTAAEIATLKELRSQGCPFDAISIELNRSLIGCRNKFNLMAAEERRCNV